MNMNENAIIYKMKPKILWLRHISYALDDKEKKGWKNEMQQLNIVESILSSKNVSNDYI